MTKLKKAPTHWAAMVVILLIFSGCQPSGSHPHEGASNDIRWARYSVEYDAVCIQTYRSVWWAVKEMVAGMQQDWAVVLDVDETVLDNSPYEEMIFKRGEKYPTGWAEWVNQADADPVPGAKAFLDSVRTLGKYAHIVFITNRDTAFEKATIENLKLRDMWREDDVMLCQREKSDTKATRRHEVQTGTGRCQGLGERKIIALIGDQLHDVVDIPEGMSVSELKEHFRDYEGWGKTAFMLPNPMYGNWMRGY